jgi:hypothetical protein
MVSVDKTPSFGEWIIQDFFRVLFSCFVRAGCESGSAVGKQTGPDYSEARSSREQTVFRVEPKLNTARMKGSQRIVLDTLAQHRRSWWSESSCRVDDCDVCTHMSAKSTSTLQRPSVEPDSIFADTRAFCNLIRGNSVLIWSRWMIRRLPCHLRTLRSERTRLAACVCCFAIRNLQAPENQAVECPDVEHVEQI